MLLSALSDTVLLALIGAMQAIFVAIIAVVMKWMDYRAQERTKKIEEKVEEVRKTTDGIIPRLVAAGKIEATNDERDRVAAVVQADAVKEAEIVRRVDAATSDGIGTVAAGSVASNVQVIKKDVKEVKRDVADVKTEVTKEVRDGVKQGISEAKAEDKN